MGEVLGIGEYSDAGTHTLLILEKSSIGASLLKTNATMCSTKVGSKWVRIYKSLKEMSKKVKKMQDKDERVVQTHASE